MWSRGHAGHRSQVVNEAEDGVRECGMRKPRQRCHTELTLDKILRDGGAKECIRKSVNVFQLNNPIFVLDRDTPFFTIWFEADVLVEASIVDKHHFQRLLKTCDMDNDLGFVIADFKLQLAGGIGGERASNDVKRTLLGREIECLIGGQSHDITKRIETDTTVPNIDSG